MQLIVELLGANTRYYFLKMTDETIKRKDISGENAGMGNHLLNGLVGFSVLFLIVFLIVHVFYS
jgi:hypothetical protein